MNALYHEVENLVEKAGNILIISHRKPDADTLGAGIALKIWLNRFGKSTTLACVDKPNSLFKFLPHVEEYQSEFELSEYDLIMIVDAGASYMTNFHLKYESLFKTDQPIINIDHHASNDQFGKVNIVDVKAASATVILYRMFKELGIEIDSEMATCLLAGIYNDTGSFMHSNTTAEVMKIASSLVASGAAIGDISKSMFRNKRVETLKLWGKVLEETTVTEDNVVVSVVREEDYEPVGAQPEHLTGVIDYLTMVPNSKYAVLINEDRQGNVKGSFRTRQNDVDVSRIAAVFGGGGHSKASGFMMEGHLEQEVRYKIVSEDLSKKSLDF